MSHAESVPSRPWWSYAHVWLVIGGPLTVVVASFFTFYLAYKGTDPVVDENYYQHGLNINRTLQDKTALVPAMQGRNHAATGGLPPAPAP